MGEKVMRFSDLSGQLVPNPEELATITVVDHPDIEDAPLRLEALPEEIADLGKLSVKAVMLDVQLPGDEEPTRHVMTTTNFNKLASERSMAEVLAGAERVVAKRRGIAANSDARNHETLEWAGTPHKGKTSPIEAQLVRENLKAINERLAAQGYRTIDLAHPDHARRYGFGAGDET
jgi:hypothetical protein